MRQSLRLSIILQKPKGQSLSCLVLINLYNYFKKIHLIHFEKSNNSNGRWQRSIGMSPYFVKEYIAAARNYKPAKMSEVFAILHEFDLKSKGIEGGKAADGELLTELVVRLIK